ncbi:MAG: type II toxin-antitoxin system RelE/ParE family toxin [Epsilonproteobacteria bacterium]|nr:type II toxin-antitoxin system RelE/ParE family toxin [Campylobacterota bacterium]
MEWVINYYYNHNERSPVKEWLDSLENEPKAEIFRVFGMLKKYGTNLGLPFIRPLENKIYEVRAKDRSGIYRVLYFAHTYQQNVCHVTWLSKENTNNTPERA